jgi:hypothetical protein
MRTVFPGWVACTSTRPSMIRARTSPVVLEAARPPVVGQVAGPAGLDLVAGQPGPVAGVALTEAGVHPDREVERGADDLGRRLRPGEIAGPDRLDRRQATDGGRRLGAAEVGQRCVGVPLPAATGVPGRLAVADDDGPGGGHAATVARVGRQRPGTTVDSPWSSTCRGPRWWSSTPWPGRCGAPWPAGGRGDGRSLGARRPRLTDRCSASARSRPTDAGTSAGSG